MISENILVIGCGGIGCELIKLLYLKGKTNITLVDFDTISLSNLNRQFIFKKKDINKSKCEVMKETYSKMLIKNHKIKNNFIVKHISDDIRNFDIEFFEEFDIIYNCLDNVETRSHVSKMCMFLKKSKSRCVLVDGGSTGFLGQSWYFGGFSECFDCLGREAEVIYPVCTIRTTPTKFEHCVIWTKTYFLEILTKINLEIKKYKNKAGILNEKDIYFKNIDSNQNNSKRFKHNKNDKMVRFDEKGALFDENGNIIIKKENREEIEDKSSDSKKSRFQNRKDLDYDENKKDDLENFSYEEIYDDLNPKSDIDIYKKYFKNIIEKTNEKESENVVIEELNDFNILFKILIQREEIIFDKDDEDLINFLYKVSVIRSKSFSIEPMNKIETENILGNIIPAVCTTNSIVASLMFKMGSKLIELKLDKPIKKIKLNNFYLSKGENIIKRLEASKWNGDCLVCNSKKIVYKSQILSDERKKDFTLKSFLENIKKIIDINIRNVSVFINEMLVFDNLFKENFNLPLKIKKNETLLIKNGEINIYVYLIKSNLEEMTLIE